MTNLYSPTIAPGKPYSFPHIDFKEQVVGPLPFEPYWRNTIGVVGEFSRGPAGPVRISSRDEFAYLYGEDLTPGSVFVRQAMLQGATNFVISRVMPGQEPSVGTVFLQSSISPATVPPVVGPTAHRTTGLRFEMRYVGEALTFPGEFIGAPVRVPRTLLTIPDFEGVGFFDFTVTDRVELASLTASGPFSVEGLRVAAGPDNLHLISVSGAGVNDFVAAAVPGRRLVPHASNTNAITITNGYLTFVSKAYERLPGVWSALVQGEVTALASATAPVTCFVPTQVTPAGNYYVVAVSYRSGDGAQLPADAFLGHFPQPRPDAAKADFYLVTLASSSGPNPVRFIRYDAGTTHYTWHDTGVQVAFGRVGATSVMLIPGARFTVPIVQGQVTVGDMGGDPGAAFLPGLAGLEVLRQLSQAIMASDSLSVLVREAVLNELLLPYSVTFRSVQESELANRIAYQLTRAYTGSTPPDDLLFGPPSNSLYGQWQWMAGGESGLRTARRYLYDAAGNPLVLFEALSPGSYGNEIRISVRPMPPGQFRIEVVDERGMAFDAAVRPEALVLSNYSVDRVTGLYPETLDSRIIRAYFVPVMNAFGAPVPEGVFDLTPQRIAPPVVGGTNEFDPAAMGVSWLRNLYLEGGTDRPRASIGEPPKEREFLKALRDIENEDCAIIAAAGVEATDMRYELLVTELIAQAERSTTVNGLRVAVLQAPRRVGPLRAPALTVGLSSNRAVMVAGHCSFVGMMGLGANAVPSQGIYAGVLAANPPHVSPASLFMGRPARGVVTVDTRNDPQSLDILTRSRLEVLHFDQGVRLFKFLNGITTSPDPYERYISVRRMMDQIIMDLYRNLIWVRSAPHTRSLRARVASAVDAYLRYLQREERIYRFSPTICNESNNSILDMSRGRLNIRVTVTPIYPADFIFIDLVRDLTAEFSMNTIASA